MEEKVIVTFPTALKVVDSAGTLKYADKVTATLSREEAIEVLLAAYKKRIPVEIRDEAGRELSRDDLISWEKFRDRYFDEGYCNNEKATAVLEAAAAKGKEVEA